MRKHVGTPVYTDVGIALNFDSIEVATTMSRGLRREIMVVKEKKSERPQM
jgi:hypothetical protein